MLFKEGIIFIKCVISLPCVPSPLVYNLLFNNNADTPSSFSETEYDIRNLLLLVLFFSNISN